ncbi:Bifunctional protein: zinc-containing alcohol dehydrogenase; quinone oxidoreductase (NADPH:quinone reductase); Similar to arginate lyase [uncultured Candidatus Thioglobus sp.]|nr:Bifunctional protein: zinc-containing alcohol dehydrogenase; quinone oxidoreductase (NADPH:quinone reductase); Similar to arginate lyase [uncultured Candidatus Thioglobus sp.]
MIRKGIYPGIKEKPPFSLGYEVVGTIDAIGSEVSDFKEGEIIVALTITGAYSEYMYLDSNDCISIPKDVEPIKALALIFNYVAAYQMLHRIAKVKTGNRILVHGASGAVGTALIQLGKLYNLEIYGTASTENLAYIQQQGAIPIDYKKQDFEKEIASLTLSGVDAVFDAIAGDNFKRSFRCLKKGGIVVAYGMFNSSVGKQSKLSSMLSFMGLLFRGWLPNGKEAQIYSIADLKKKHPSWYKEDYLKLILLLKDAQISPVISNTFNLLEAKKAHKLLESRGIQFCESYAYCSN